MKLSIIVPIYNVEKYLPQCIDSILNQDYVDFELILVNDGSPDDSLSICRQYAEKDKRVRVINKPNGGLTSSRKAGAKIAKGEYVICVDGDDYVEQGYFSCVARSLDEFNPDMVVLSHYSLEDNKKICAKILWCKVSCKTKNTKKSEINSSMILRIKIFQIQA